MRKILLLLLILINMSCSFEYFDSGEIIRKGHSEIYSSPYWDDDFSPSERYQRIVVAATNDMLGQVAAYRERIGQDQFYYVGGVAVLARYFELLRKKFPGQTLFLDAGNIYQGTLLSNSDQGESIAKLYNQLGYDAITIGNRDFEFGPSDSTKYIASLDEDAQGQLKRNISLHKTPYVVSNIIDLKTARLIEWKNTSPYIIKEINGLKVAVIGGLSPAAWKSTPKENLRGLYIGGLSKVLIKYAHFARKEGAQVVIALLHAGGYCGQQFMKKYHINQYQVNFNPRGENFCNTNHEVFQIIENIPKGTIDAVVSGHSRSKIANFYRDIPIIQSFSDGLFMGRMELVYDRVKKQIDPQKTQIHQPTKLCYQFFKSSQDCHRGDPKALVPATFLGELIYAHAHVAKTVAQYKSQIQGRLQREIVQLDELMDSSTIGSIISYSIRRATDTQIGFTTGTGITLKGGESITYQDIYKIIPREDRLSKVFISGQELKQLVEIATSGTGRQQGQFSGLKVVLHNGVLEERDLNGDGKKEDWEKNRLKTVKLSDGSKIENDKMYTLGTQTFFSEDNAGNYDFIFSNISPDRKVTFYNKTNRQALLKFFKSLVHDQKTLKKILTDEKNWLITI